MTIFLTGTPADTADDLDPKRLNRQIQECCWLINMVEGTGKWKNHPCNFMYKDHIDWVKKYRDCLVAYKNKDYIDVVAAVKKGKSVKTGDSGAVLPIVIVSAIAIVAVLGLVFFTKEKE